MRRSYFFTHRLNTTTYVASWLCCAGKDTCILATFEEWGGARKATFLFFSFCFFYFLPFFVPLEFAFRLFLREAASK